MPSTEVAHNCPECSKTMWLDSAKTGWHCACGHEASFQTRSPMDPQELLGPNLEDSYWKDIEREIARAGVTVTHAVLLNHQAAHLLAWARIARDAALVARAKKVQI